MNVQIEKILVTTDFSETSLAAFPLARKIAEQNDAEVHCLYVLREPDPFWTGEGTFGPVLPTGEELRRQATEHLTRIVLERFHDLEKPAIPVVRTGNDLVEILDYARSNEIDLIVMATHGHTGLKHVLIGSTTERVVREAACPVLTVRAPE